MNEPEEVEHAEVVLGIRVRCQSFGIVEREPVLNPMHVKKGGEEPFSESSVDQRDIERGNHIMEELLGFR